MKRLLSALILMALIFVITACGDGLKTEKLGGVKTEEGEIYPEKIAYFDGKAMAFDTFRYYFLNFRDLYLAQDASYFEKEDAEEDLKAEVLDNLLINRAVELLAAEKGVSLTAQEKADAEKEIAETIQLYGKDNLVASLHESYMSQQMYREMTQYSVLYQKLFDALYGENGSEAWDDETFLAYFRREYAAVQEIFLSYETGESATYYPETLKKAQEILTQLENGASFWELVEAYGEDPAMELEPDGYYITEGEAETVLYETAFSLRENEVSEPTAAAAGVYLIRRVPILDSKALLRKADVLGGYEDGAGNEHTGVYQEAYLSLLKERSSRISVELDPIWEKITSSTVF